MMSKLSSMNPLILLLTLTAVFTLGACAVNRNNLESVQQKDDLFDGDPESCSMCHVDVEIEILKAKTKHMESGVDCITCHGLSIGHIQDEINEVKPYRVITKKTTNSFCHGCHDTSTSHDEKIISRMACTNCHDAHATFVPGK